MELVLRLSPNYCAIDSVRGFMYVGDPGNNNPTIRQINLATQSVHTLSTPTITNLWGAIRVSNDGTKLYTIEYKSIFF